MVGTMEAWRSQQLAKQSSQPVDPEVRRAQIDELKKSSSRASFDKRKSQQSVGRGNSQQSVGRAGTDSSIGNLEGVQIEENPTMSTKQNSQESMGGQETNAKVDISGEYETEKSLKSAKTSLQANRDEMDDHIDSLIEKNAAMSVRDARKLKKKLALEAMWTQGHKFQSAVGLVIIANAVVLGLEVDHAEEWETTFGILDHLFTVIFLLEMLLRFYIEGLREYFSDQHSILDFAICIMGVVDVWIIKPVLQGNKTADDLRSLSVLRIMRLLRLVRLVRVIRIFEIFKELAIIAQSFAAGGRTLMWGGVFVGIVVYVFGIFAVESFGRAKVCEDARMLKPKTKIGDDGDDSVGDERCQDTYAFGTTGTQFTLFGTLDRAMLTLYTCVTDGCGSDVIYKMVYRTPWVIVYWYFFVFITSFGLVNVMVGLFCENVFAKQVENEKEMAATLSEKRSENLQKMSDVFKAMDMDGSHTISRMEFLDALRDNETVQKCMEELGLDENVGLFDTLDVDQGGVLSLEEFFSGVQLCMNGNDPCKVKDTIGTYLLAQAILKRIDALSECVGRGSSASTHFARGSTGRLSQMRQSKSKSQVVDKPGLELPGPEGAMGGASESSDWLRCQFETLHGMMSGMNESLNEKMDTLTRRVNDISERQERLETNLATMHGEGLTQQNQNKNVTPRQEQFFGTLCMKTDVKELRGVNSHSTPS